jgi:multicomponent Na+:H+ antiporter subunit F
MLLGIWRVLKGPALLDRLLTIQLFGSTGVAILLVLSKVFALPALLDVALLIAILAAAAPAALVQRLRQQKLGSKQRTSL